MFAERFGTASALMAKLNGERDTVFGSLVELSEAS
jgi:hypothetical protein